MDGTTVFQVTYHIYGKTVEPALSLHYRIHVQKRLGRMLVGTVTRIDNRHRRHLGSDFGGSFHRMTHHDHIHIIGDDPDGVFESFTFGNAGISGIRKTYDSGSQAVNRCFK